MAIRQPLIWGRKSFAPFSAALAQLFIGCVQWLL